MNSAVIVDIKYRLLKNSFLDYQKIEIIPFSATISENVDSTKSGNLHRITLRFNVAKVGVETDQLLKEIRNVPAQFIATDANGRLHNIGNNEFKARLTYQKALDGNPGSFNGYRCTVTLSTPEGAIVE